MQCVASVALRGADQRRFGEVVVNRAVNIEAGNSRAAVGVTAEVVDPLGVHAQQHVMLLAEYAGVADPVPGQELRLVVMLAAVGTAAECAGGGVKRVGPCFGIVVALVIPTVGQAA